MSGSLKKKTGSALMWSFIDKGGQQVIQLGFMLVLVRLLSQEDFGLVAVLAIFTALATLLQDSGFSSALIRKQKEVQEEYNSVFYFNILVSVLVYLLLFIAAPFIASYYEKPILTNLSRVIFTSFVFNSFGLIQNVNLIRRMDFKINTRITFISGIISGLVGVALAYNGFGVWSIVVMTVLQSFLRNLLLWVFIKWLPSASFSFSHIKNMWTYSSKLLLGALMNQLCTNIYSNIIGKFFSLGQAGIYSQAVKLNTIPQSIIGEGVKGVTYPLLTRIDDEDRRIKAFRKIVRITAFITFPVALILIVSAYPIVYVLLSDKWVSVAPYLQILAVGGAVYPFLYLIGIILQYEGKSGRLFIVDFVRNSLLLIFIPVFISHGVMGLTLGVSISQLVSFILGAYIVNKIVDYSIKSFLWDLLPYLIISIVAYVPSYFLGSVISNNFILLPVQLIGGSLLYIVLIKMLGSKVLEDLIFFIKNKGNE